MTPEQSAEHLQKGLIFLTFVVMAVAALAVLGYDEDGKYKPWQKALVIIGAGAAFLILFAIIRYATFIISRPI